MGTGRRLIGPKTAFAMTACLAAIVAACGQAGSTPAASPRGTTTQSAATSEPPVAGTCNGVALRWFVGLGSGTTPSQIDAEKAFVRNYNDRRPCGHARINLEIVPNAQAYDVLKAEMAAGNSPDIIGPVGTKDRDGFEGLFLDLTAEIAKNHFDLTQFDPALVDYLKAGSEGQIGLPYDIYPGYIWYNRDIFDRAGLAPLPVRMGEKYQGANWTWDTLGKVAAQLTLDSSGRKSTDPGFDATHIVQYGMDFQAADARRVASLFGAGSFIARDGKTAQIPDVWATAFGWYHSAVWKGHYVPSAAAAASELLAKGNGQASGHVAMNAAWSWSIGTIATSADSARVKTWDIAVIPAGAAGVTTSPLDMNTFVIPTMSSHPDEDFLTMLAIMADPGLMKAYGGEPAAGAKQAAYFESMDAQLAPIFPGNRVTWSVLGEMAKVPAVPSQDVDLPNHTRTEGDIDAFFAELGRTQNLDLSKELSILQGTLQLDWDCACPLLNG